MAISTEEKIRDAAKRIFLEKGFGSTTTRDIAESADTNIALVNYYFHSKERLFQEIFQDSFAETFAPATRILNDDLPLEAKIYKFVDYMTDLLKKDPLLPVFVLSEMRGENTKMCEMASKMQEAGPNKFLQQLEREAEKGNIRRVDFDQVEVSLMSMVVFPFISMNVLKLKKQMSTEEFYRFVEERKKAIPEMILSYLRCREE
ncbi:MAG: TetR/AcrR family transcriptional regulator [Saprospiraceae bacterium]|nr:TetR/AcrR family transcriptional regulator [Saprospiraceae bacterium]MCB0573597.1 TetR/AcrR family transcriptional regulator [Saprospiraceae bacterium]MCB9305882.1 TetR/AcrR family transcriptional regulator [Lewinellaceae bacterium]MCB9356666.1 TetR/AcrR family transcriptional regulator [Lewinellaceae bacterium]